MDLYVSQLSCGHLDTLPDPPPLSHFQEHRAHLSINRIHTKDQQISQTNSTTFFVVFNLQGCLINRQINQITLNEVHAAGSVRGCIVTTGMSAVYLFLEALEIIES